MSTARLGDPTMGQDRSSLELSNWLTNSAELMNLTQIANLSQFSQLPNMSYTQQALGPRRDSFNIVIPVTIIYSLIFITGVIGNISTCIVIKKNRSMHTATNYYLFSLAISDFLLLMSGVPHEVYYIWSKYPYVFGEYFCIGRGLLAETSANATVLTITAFTVERYMAICHPFLGQAMSKLSRAIRIIILIWILSVLTAIPQAAQFGIDSYEGLEMCVVVRVIIKHSFQLSTYIFFFVPMSIIMVLYILIGVHLYRAHLISGIGDVGRLENGNQGIGGIGGRLSNGRRQSQQKHRFDMKSNPSDSSLYRYYGGGGGGVNGGGRGSESSNNQLSSVRGRINHHSMRRVLKMLVAVVICFFLCWAPFHAQRLWAVYATSVISAEELNVTKQHVTINTIMTYISGVLYYLSTCVNPLLYNLMSNKFREAFKAVLFGKKLKNSLHSRNTLDSRYMRRNTILTSSTQRELSESEPQAKQTLLKSTFNV